MMSRRLSYMLLLGTLLSTAALLHGFDATADVQPSDANVAAVGKLAPAFTLTNPYGRSFSLDKERQGKKAVVVMFISTQCPVSNAYNQRMIQLAKDYSAKNVRFLAINANKTETVDEVSKHSRNHKFTFPVLIDVGNAVADQYDAKVTPHTYLIDDKGILRYRGRIDDSQDPAGIKSRDLRAALDAVLAGKQVANTETRAFGCSIQRMEKESGA